MQKKLYIFPIYTYQTILSQPQFILMTRKKLQNFYCMRWRRIISMKIVYHQKNLYLKVLVYSDKSTWRNKSLRPYTFFQKYAKAEMTLTV